MPRPRALVLLLPLLPVLAVAGCGDPAASFGEATSHSARERPVDWRADDAARLKLRAMGPAMRDDGTATAPAFSADVPKGWETQPPRQFRDASWSVTGTEAECSLLASVRGGMRGNLDRWCDQLGAPHLDDAAIAKAPAMQLLGKPAKLFALEGTFMGKPGWKMLGVITDTDPQATLKFTGPQAMVEQQMDAFLSLARSIRAGGAPAAQSPRQPSAPPAQSYTAEVPTGWTQLPANPARFQDALFSLANGEGECSLTAQVGGGLRGNVDRWTGQFGLPALTDAELDTAQRHSLLGQPARLIELAGAFRGKEGMAMLALITDGDTVSTLKLVAPKAVADAERGRFLLVASTLRPGSGPATAPSPDHAAPHVTPPPDPHGGPAAGPALSADTPAGWTPKADSTRSLHHTFGTDGEVYFSALGGDVLQNLNVWRDDMKQPPLLQEQLDALPKVTLLGTDAAMMDITGDYKAMSGQQIANARMLVAAAKVEGAMVYVKLVGNAADVAAQADAFRAFCKSIRRNP
ncbi:MAG: hypothetical protein U1E73_10135 [Planctomycetota bacterium]